MERMHDKLRDIAANDDHTINGELTRDGMTLMDAAGTLEGIFEAMDGQEWNADTLEAIADLMAYSGYAFRAPDELDEDDGEDDK